MIRMPSGSRFLVLVALLAAPCRGLSAEDAPDSRVLDSFSVPNDGDVLMVSVQIGGRGELFIVDTGCTHVFYDTSLRGLLGPPRDVVQSAASLGGVQLELFDPPAAFLGRLDLRGPNPENAAPVACIDLSGLRGAMRENIRGLIGCSFLQHHIIKLELDRGKLSFLKEAGADAGVRVPIGFVDETPVIRAELPGIGETRFAIDTGATGKSGVFSAATAKALGARNLLTPVQAGQTIELLQAAPVTGRLWNVPFLRIAGFKHENLVFGEHSRGQLNLLGLGYLSRYIVTIDFPAQAMYLKPSSAFADRDPHYRSGNLRAGIGVDREERGAIISVVERGSPASRAGLCAGDLLLELDGRDVRHSRLYAIDKQLWDAGERLRVKIRRRARTLELMVRLPPREGGRIGNTRDNNRPTAPDALRVQPPRNGAVVGAQNTAPCDRRKSRVVEQTAETANERAQ
jgi:hypothetical protein